MPKENVKIALLTGVVSGFTAAVSILALCWAYIEISEWYRDYQKELAEERYESISPDRRNGSFCPECKSTDVGRYVYGYFNYDADSATAQAVRSGIIIPGGCAFAETYPKFKCNRCNYKWGNFK